MILDDKKIEEIIEKEIKEQVTKKINSLGKKAILKMYEDYVYIAIQNTLEEVKKESIELFEKEFIKDKEAMQKEIANDIASKFTNSIKQAFLDAEYSDELY